MPAVYDQMNYRQFTNAVNGYRKQKDLESRERFAQMRKMMWAMFVSSANVKKGFQEKDLMIFPWEQQMAKKISQEENEKLLQGVEQVKAFYARIDKTENKA